MQLPITCRAVLAISRKAFQTAYKPLKGTFQIRFNSSFISDLKNDDTVSVTVNIIISSMGKGGGK
jgi:hypothetical protein